MVLRRVLLRRVVVATLNAGAPDDEQSAPVLVVLARRPGLRGGGQRISDQDHDLRWGAEQPQSHSRRLRPRDRPHRVTLEDQTTDDPAQVDSAAALFGRIRGYAESMEASRGIIQEALQRCESQQQ